MKVLIADGSPVVIDRFINILKEIPGVDLLSPTFDAKATLRSIRRNGPEVLIVDSRLPGAQGRTFIQSIHQEKPAMLLIVLSNVIYPQCGKYYTAAGADFFMDKSNEFVRLREFVRELAGKPATPVGRPSRSRVRKRLGLSKLITGLHFVPLAFGIAIRFISP